MLCLCAVLGAAAKMEAQLVMLSPLEDHLMAPRTSRPLCTCSTLPAETCKGNLEFLFGETVAVNSGTF